MGFSYMKSKLVLFNSYRTICSNNMVHTAISNFKPGLSEILGGNKFIMPMLHVMCCLGVKQFSTLHNFHQFGNRIDGANPYPHYHPLHRSVSTLRARSLMTTAGNRKTYHLVARSVTTTRAPWLMNISQKCLGKPKTCLLLGSLVVFISLFGRIERIPYSGRAHCAISDKIDSLIGGFFLKTYMTLKGYKGKELPPTNPKCIRAGLIIREIIQATHSGLGIDPEFSVIVNGSEVTDLSREKTNYRGIKIESSFGVKKEFREVTSSQNELACKEIEQNGARKPLIRKPATRHLNKGIWKVTVMHSYLDNAVCFPGRNLLVLGGLERYRSDARIAFTFGHEIGHAVARHSAEALMRALLMLTLSLSFNILGLSLLGFIANSWPVILPWIMRRRELEADYIGLMLMACAGYDPREAPKRFQASKWFKHSKRTDILSTHPANHKRVELLNKAMEEALTVYNEVKAGRGLEASFRFNS